MGPLGWTEMVVIFIIALVVFGPEKLPDLAKTAAKGLREFRRATEDLKANWQEHMREAEHPINDIRQTIRNAQTDVEEASAKIRQDESPAPEPPSGPEAAPSEPPPDTVPETKSDAN